MSNLIQKIVNHSILFMSISNIENFISSVNVKPLFDQNIILFVSNTSCHVVYFAVFKILFSNLYDWYCH